MYRIEDDWGTLNALVSVFAPNSEYKLINSFSDLPHDDAFYQRAHNMNKQEFFNYIIDTLKQNENLNVDCFYIKFVNGDNDICIEQCQSSRHDTDPYDVIS